jgi:hypothetical protein
MSHATIFWQDSDIKTTLIKKAVAQNLALSDVSSQCNKTLVIFFKSCCDNKSLKNSWWSRICKGCTSEVRNSKRMTSTFLTKLVVNKAHSNVQKVKEKKKGNPNGSKKIFSENSLQNIFRLL